MAQGLSLGEALDRGTAAHSRGVVSPSTTWPGSAGAFQTSSAPSSIAGKKNLPGAGEGRRRDGTSSTWWRFRSRPVSEVDASAAVMIVGEAIKKIGQYDLILTGYKAAGDGTGEFGPRLAQYLGLPQIIRAKNLIVGDGKLTARRSLASGYAVLEAELPALASIDAGANHPRHASLPGSIAAYDEREVTIWSADDLGLGPEVVAESVCTEVRGTFAGPERERGRVIEGEPRAAAKDIVQELKRRGLLGQF